MVTELSLAASPSPFVFRHLSSPLGADDLEPCPQADILPRKRTLWPLIPHHIALELLSNVSTHGQSFCLPFGNNHDPPTRQQVKAAVKQRISFCICPEEKLIVIWWGQEVHCRPRHHAKLANCLAFDELTGQQLHPCKANPSKPFLHFQLYLKQATLFHQGSLLINCIFACDLNAGLVLCEIIRAIFSNAPFSFFLLATVLRLSRPFGQDEWTNLPFHLTY